MEIKDLTNIKPWIEAMDCFFFVLAMVSQESYSIFAQFFFHSALEQCRLVFYCLHYSTFYGRLCTESFIILHGKVSAFIVFTQAR